MVVQYRPLGVLVGLLPGHASVTHPHLAAPVVAAIELVYHLGVGVAQLAHGSGHVSTPVGLPQDSLALVLQVVGLGIVVIFLIVPRIILNILLLFRRVLEIVVAYAGGRLQVRHLGHTGAHLGVGVVLAGTALLGIGLA